MMDTGKTAIVTGASQGIGAGLVRESSRPASAEQRLQELGIELPVPPEPFGLYVEAVQTGNLLFLTGMLPTEGRAAKFIGRVGAEFDADAGHEAARLAALNALAVGEAVFEIAGQSDAGCPAWSRGGDLRRSPRAAQSR